MLIVHTTLSLLADLHSIEIRVAPTIEGLDGEHSLCAYNAAAYSTGQARLVSCDTLRVGQYVRLQLLSDEQAYLELSEIAIKGF